MEKTLWITGLGETMRPDFLKEAVQYPYGKALFLVPNLYFRNLGPSPWRRQDEYHRCPAAGNPALKRTGK